LSKKTVFVTRRIPQPGLDLLKDFEMTMNPDDRVLTKQEVIAGGKGKDAVLCLLTDPIDAEIIGNRIYVIEYGGNQGIWEVTFPVGPPIVTLSAPSALPNGSFRFNVNGPTGFTYEISGSTNFLNWLSLTNLTSTSTQFQFIDLSATNWSQRFYRGSAH